MLIAHSLVPGSFCSSAGKQGWRHPGLCIPAGRAHGDNLGGDAEKSHPLSLPGFATPLSSCANKHPWYRNSHANTGNQQYRFSIRQTQQLGLVFTFSRVIFVVKKVIVTKNKLKNNHFKLALVVWVRKHLVLVSVSSFDDLVSFGLIN